jgi:hypothetical protein
MAQQRRYPITLDERLLATLLRQPICDRRMAGKGHQERFPSPRLRDRCGFREGTFAGTRANGRDAPKTAIQRQREMLDVMTAAFNRLRVGKSRGLSLIA